MPGNELAQCFIRVVETPVTLLDKNIQENQNEKTKSCENLVVASCIEMYAMLY
jgi:hypothetical protein